LIKDLKAGDPASVGPYRLLGRLGAGGMGEVFLGKSPGGRLVAIKLIRPELSEERGFRNRFASEISAAKNVSGIYTAAVVDADAEAEQPWMATVYVAGPSLTDAVEENGPLPVKSVLALAAGLAEALQAIHRVGLVHRDMKPSNVLLATDGPRVIDFGISLALERSMMTTTGMVLGSPGFMSPEQARGQREVGAPTDMFSLGAVLAFAATGESPFGRGPATALLYRVVNEPPDLASVPASLKPLIEQCLSKDPVGRPTPAELLASIGDVDVITGEWLPQPIAETMVRYMPTLSTPLPPGLREAGAEQAAVPVPVPAESASAGPVPATPGAPVPMAATPASAAAGPSSADPATPAPDVPAPVPAVPAGYESTVLASVIPPAAAALPSIPDAAAATRAEHGLLPQTALIPASGAATPVPGALTAGRDIPGGTGGTPPGRAASPLRRWRWLITAAAAAVIVAVVAVLLTSHSNGTGKGSPTASLAGATKHPSAAPKSSKPTPTATKQQPTVTPTSQQAATTPVTQPSATATTAPTSSPTATPTAASSPTATATTAPTSSATPTTAPTTANATPTTAQTNSAASNPAASPTQPAAG
jgi:hypothetical protein